MFSINSARKKVWRKMEGTQIKKNKSTSRMLGLVASPRFAKSSAATFIKNHTASYLLIFTAWSVSSYLTQHTHTWRKV